MLWKGLQLTPSCPVGQGARGWLEMEGLDAERWWPGWEALAHFSYTAILGVLGWWQQGPPRGLGLGASLNCVPCTPLWSRPVPALVHTQAQISAHAVHTHLHVVTLIFSPGLHHTPHGMGKLRLGGEQRLALSHSPSG